MSHSSSLPISSWAFPAAALAFFALTAALGLQFTRSPGGVVFAIVLLIILFGTVFAAVHHAEVIAHRVGEPFGTLILTLSVIVIEVALITSIMLGEKAQPALARDTVFAVIMIVCNLLIGVCLLAGGLRYREQEFQVTGSKVYLSALMVLSTISLILPNYTLTTPGPVYAMSQLLFVSVITVLLYGTFLYTQTVLHNDYFILATPDAGDDHPVATNREFAISAVLLIASLVGVISLSKTFSAVVDAGSDLIGAPPAFAGILVAFLILLPESVAAVNAARRNQLQKSINLALGSSLATIGMTIPAVAVVAYILDKQLVLGLNPRETVILVLTLLLSILTFGTGRTNILFGMIHILVFATYLFTVFVP